MEGRPQKHCIKQESSHLASLGSKLPRLTKSEILGIASKGKDMATQQTLNVVTPPFIA